MRAAAVLKIERLFCFVLFCSYHLKLLQFWIPCYSCGFLTYQSLKQQIMLLIYFLRKPAEFARLSCVLPSPVGYMPLWVLVLLTLHGSQFLGRCVF